MFLGLQPWHIVVIVIIGVIVFGPRRLPEIGKGLGRSISEFRKGSQEMTNAFRDGLNETSGHNEQANAAIGGQTSSQTLSMSATNGTPVIAASNMEATKFCTSCGSQNSQAASFCNKCGQKFAG